MTTTMVMVRMSRAFSCHSRLSGSNTVPDLGSPRLIPITTAFHVLSCGSLAYAWRPSDVLASVIYGLGEGNERETW